MTINNNIEDRLVLLDDRTRIEHEGGGNRGRGRRSSSSRRRGIEESEEGHYYRRRPHRQQHQPHQPQQLRQYQGDDYRSQRRRRRHRIVRRLSIRKVVLLAVLSFCWMVMIGIMTMMINDGESKSSSFVTRRWRWKLDEINTATLNPIDRATTTAKTTTTTTTTTTWNPNHPFFQQGIELGRSTRHVFGIWLWYWWWWLYLGGVIALTGIIIMKFSRIVVLLRTQRQPRRTHNQHLDSPTTTTTILGQQQPHHPGLITSSSNASFWPLSSSLWPWWGSLVPSSRSSPIVHPFVGASTLPPPPARLRQRRHRRSSIRNDSMQDDDNDDHDDEELGHDTATTVTQLDLEWILQTLQYTNQQRQERGQSPITIRNFIEFERLLHDPIYLRTILEQQQTSNTTSALTDNHHDQRRRQRQQQQSIMDILNRSCPSISYATFRHQQQSGNIKRKKWNEQQQQECIICLGPLLMENKDDRTNDDNDIDNGIEKDQRSNSAGNTTCTKIDDKDDNSNTKDNDNESNTTSYRMIRELPCHHVFHSTCIEQWIMTEYINRTTSSLSSTFPTTISVSCPICKTPIMTVVGEGESNNRNDEDEDDVDDSNNYHTNNENRA